MACTRLPPASAAGPAVAARRRPIPACGAAQRVAQRRARSTVPRAAATQQQQQQQPVAALDAYQRLKGVQVIRCDSGARADITSLWGPDERALIVWARTFGCPFCWEYAVQLQRDALPVLDAAGVKLFLVAIGTYERSKDFVAETGFPAERLLADPEGDTYAALQLVKGWGPTFFSYETPLALLKRMQAPGGMDDLRERVLPNWKPWQPPKGFNQALQQGGIFVFEGDRVAYSHYDQATGAHADLDGVVSMVRGLAEAAAADAAACDCAAPPPPAGSSA